MPDAFDRFPSVASPNQAQSGDAFDRFPEPDESFLKSSTRTALQIPQGLAEATPPGIAANLWQFLAAGETDLGVDEYHNLRAISERNGEPFDEDAYENARRDVLDTIPTVSNIGRGIENKTGIPLEPKTRLQKGVRFASTATKVIPKPNEAAPRGYTFRGLNTGLPRPVLGAGVEGVREVLLEMGIPEPVADLASFAVIKPTSDSSGIFKVGAATKKSGLTTRQFEKIDKPTEVSPNTIQKINSKTEKEFRDLTGQIIEKSPIKETHEALAKDYSFKTKANEAFQEVESLAESLPNQFDTKSLKSDLSKVISKKKNQDLTPSEFDKNHEKFVRDFIKETPDKPFRAKELVSQYRKNNKQLSEAYEPGQSFAFNRAKREALLDYNRVISDIIEKEFPNSEFSKLFKETNKRWADINNSEAITSFLDELFDKKINFSKGRQLFEKNGMTVPFERALGKEGFAKFKTLLGDLLSTEQANKFLQAASDQSAKEISRSIMSYLIHPTAGKISSSFKALKGGYNTIYNMILDKPQLAVTWDRALNAAKRGNLKAAQKEISVIKAAEEVFDKKDQAAKSALEKFKKNQEVDKPKLSHADENITVAQKPDKNEVLLDKLKKDRNPEAQARLKKKKEVENELTTKSKSPKENSYRGTEMYPQTKENWEPKALEYTIEDFPTKQEAQEYLDHLIKQRNRSFSQNPKREFRPTDLTIEHMKNLIKNGYKKQPVKSLTEQKIKEVQRQDISKAGLKQQKEYLIDKISDSLSNPPNADTITIHVPGDGVFKLKNNEQALKKFLDRVKKKWPDKPLKLTKKELNQPRKIPD